jgi:hypothetical protein
LADRVSIKYPKSASHVVIERFIAEQAHNRIARDKSLNYEKKEEYVKEFAKTIIDAGIADIDRLVEAHILAVVGRRVGRREQPGDTVEREAVRKARLELDRLDIAVALLLAVVGRRVGRREQPEGIVGQEAVHKARYVVAVRSLLLAVAGMLAVRARNHIVPLLHSSPDCWLPSA